MRLRIGTRGSKLALTQTQLVIDQLLGAHSDLEIEVVEIKTIGDKRQGTKAAAIPDKKKWIQQLEEGVKSREIDLAVHSGKDLPADMEEGTTYLSIGARENPYDIFVGKEIDGTRVSFVDLPNGAVVGTASKRRGAQLLRLRPDITVVPHRGNIPTRLQKLEDNPELSGIVIAAAGPARLGLEIPHNQFTKEEMIPALGQGTLVSQFAEDRTEIRELLLPLVIPEVEARFRAESSCVRELGADCHSAVGAFATISGQELSITGRVLSENGAELVEKSISGSIDQPDMIGKNLAAELLDGGARELL